MTLLFLAIAQVEHLLNELEEHTSSGSASRAVAHHHAAAGPLPKTSTSAVNNRSICPSVPTVIRR